MTGRPPHTGQSPHDHRDSAAPKPESQQPAHLDPQEAEALATLNAVDYPPALDEPESLRELVISGVAWQTVVSISVQASRIVSSLVLVRLLTPDDYGLAGMALIFAGFVGVFLDLGFGAALVQRPTITEADRSTVFWTTVSMGLVLTVVMIGLAGSVAKFFHQPELKNLVIALSFTLIIGSLGLTQGSLLHRALKYREVSICIIIATVVACVTAVAVAAAGGGAWALIAYQLAMATMVTVSLWQIGAWRPRFVYSRSSAKDLGGFGANLVGTNLLGYVHVTTDNILIGRYLSSFALGLYTVAYTVILIPIGRLFQPIGNTLFAAVSRMQGDTARVASAWVRAVRCVSAVIMPVILGLFVVAPDFVQVLFGPRWHGATPVIRILGFVTIAAGLSTIADAILLALNRPGILFRLTLINTILVVGAFVLGLRWGIVGVAASYAVVTIPIYLARVALVNRMVEVSTGMFLRAISGLVEATLMMTVVCWLSREALIHVGLSNPLRLVAVILIGVLTYCAGIVWRDRELIGEVKSVLPLRRGLDTGVATAA